MISDHNKSLQFAKNALATAEKLEYLHGKGLAHLNIAQAYLDSVETFPLAKTHIHEALKIFETVRDKLNSAQCYVLLAYGYRSHKFNISQL